MRSPDFEDEYGQTRAQTGAAAPSAEPAPPPPAADRPPVAPRPPAAPLAPRPPPAPKPAAPVAAAPAPPAPRAPAPPAATPPRRPTLGQSQSGPAVPPTPPPVAPAIESARPASTNGWPAPAPPPLAADRSAPAEDRGLAPPVAAFAPVGVAAGSARSGGDSGRPSAPGGAPPPRRNPWPLIALVALLFVAVGIALAAYVWKDQPRDIGAKTAPGPADPAQTPQNKIAERIGAADDSQAKPPPPAPAETPIPTVPVPVTPVPAPPAPGPQAGPAPQHVAENGAPAPAPAPAASRAAMLIGVSSDPQKPLVELGSALWSTLPATSGQPSTLAVRIEVEIPEQKMHVTVTIRKNADPNLPATHTIDFRATFAEGAEIKGIQDMGLPQMRKSDATTGDSLSGVRVKISDSYYLVGLTRSDADAAHNLALLATRSWMDFPLLLNDERIAKLTFEKGDAGDRVIAQALDAWK